MIAEKWPRRKSTVTPARASTRVASVVPYTFQTSTARTAVLLWSTNRYSASPHVSEVCGAPQRPLFYRNATARQKAASPPWKRQGKQPNWILRSSTRSISPPRFSMWMTSWGNSSVCMIW